MSGLFNVRLGWLNIPQREFCREIVQIYLTRFSVFSYGPERSLSLSSVHRNLCVILFNGEDHFIMVVPNNKRRNCAIKSVEECAKNVKVAYVLNVFLHFIKNK